MFEFPYEFSYHYLLIEVHLASLFCLAIAHLWLAALVGSLAEGLFDWHSING